MTEMIGKRVNDRYQLISVIGGGGMAVVYKARDLILDRMVAVKVLRSEFSDDEEFIRRFRREARSVASLSHPNIVSIYDIGDDRGDIYYIVMEYVEGETLKQLIKREAPLALGQSLNIMDQITSAIAHAHEQSIVHRDIKPHNILIAKNGQVKVTDFGIAVAMTSVTMTHTNSVIGSAHYFSPEQARGGYVDTKSDIYSLGIVLFEMLTGELPFSGTSPVSVALKHLQEDIPDPRDSNPAIPQSVENIILRALSKDPVYRYEKVEDMREDMRTALNPERLREPKFFISDDDQTTKMFSTPANDGSHSGGNHNGNHKESNGSSGHSSGKGDEKKKRKKRKRLWILLILLALLIGAGIAAAFLMPKWLHVEDVTVPNVVGMDQQKAENLLEGKNLQVDIERVTSDKHDEGKVVSQDPTDATTVKKNSTVHLNVSQGPEKVKVDNYLNQDKDSVELLTKSLNFKDVQFTEEYSERYGKGVVFEQNPSPGTEVIPEETVLKLTYSKGSNIVEVPDLSGHTKDEAEQLVKDQELQAEYQGEEFSHLVDEGEVTRQSPDPGTGVGRGETVKFWISKGPEPEPRPVTFNQPIKVEVPDQSRKKGRSIHVRIVYSDANHDHELFIEEDITHSKTYDQLDLTVAPDGEVSVWVYEDGNLTQMIQESYDDMKQAKQDEEQ